MVSSIANSAANLIRLCNLKVTARFFGGGAIAGFGLKALYNGAMKRSFTGRDAIIYTLIGAGAGLLLATPLTTRAANLIRRSNRQIRQNDDPRTDFKLTTVFFSVGAIAGFGLNTLYNGAVKRSFSGRDAIMYTLIGAGAGLLHAIPLILDFACHFKSRENNPARS
jgi:uncharacterized membrane protein